MHVYSHTKGLYSSPVYPQDSVQFVLQEDEVPCDPGSPNLSYWGLCGLDSWLLVVTTHR